MTQTVEERLLILMRNKKMSKTELAKEIGGEQTSRVFLVLRF